MISGTNLVDIDLALAQLDLSLCDLVLEFGVGLGDVVEGEDRNAQTAEQVASEDNETPERQLCIQLVSVFGPGER